MALAGKINPIKVKQEADKQEKAGRLDQAIVLYRQLLEVNSRDWNTINKIGDLYAKLNKPREASLEYAKVADFYAKDGFLLKAIAIWKKINKLDASSLDPYLNLADLYAKQGLAMEAKGQYQYVVDEYIKRGRAREAAGVLNKIVEIDPGDLKVRSKLADLYTRDGNTAKAVEEYVAIAEELNKKGHLAEALQVLEKGLRLDAKSDRLREELARIHLLQKNYEKAAHYLEGALRNAPSDPRLLSRLGEAYLGGHKIDEAEAIFRRLLELDRSSQEARIQMARVHLFQGQFDRAYDEFLPVAEELLERREGEKAASLLQQLVQKNPLHVRSLAKLGEIYRLLRNDRAVVATYSQLTEAYVSQGDYEQAASVLDILIKLDPQNAQYRSKLQFVRSKGRAASTPQPTPGAAGGFEIEEGFDLSLSEEAGGPDLAPAAPRFEPRPPPQTAPGEVPRRPRIELSGPLGEEDTEFIEEHLAEGRVFCKYGLVDKALDQFEAIVARFPDNSDARKELLDLYREKGQATKAAEQALALAEICRLQGRAEEARTHEEKAQGLVPGLKLPPLPAAAAPAVALGPGPPVEPLLAPELLEQEAIALEEEPAEVAIEVEGGGLETSDLGVPVAPASPEAALQDLGEVSLTLEEEPPAADASDLDALVEASAGPFPSEGLSLEGLSFDTPEASLGLEAPPIVTERRPARPVLPATPAPSPAVPSELQRALEEVDSYVSLGFIDDAKSTLREIGRRYSGHPVILEKIGELGLDREVVEEAAPAPASGADDVLGELDLGAPPAYEPPIPQPLPEPTTSDLGQDGGGFDLGAELGDLFGAHAAVEEPAAEVVGTDLGDAGLSEIFKEFRRGVDQQLGKEDFDTRYNLGIAYKEMGLVDEAIAEFQLAAKDENRLLECSSMLGICFLEKGMPKLAVKWFEKGLQVPGRTEEEYQGLRYDLAAAHEAAGETGAALGLYTELYGQDASFRDVATKVRELKG